MAEQSRPQTVAALRDLIASRLAGAVAEPLTEARDILACLHDAPRSWSTVHANDSVADLLVELALNAAEKRVAGAPMAYAVGRAAFRHLFLHVDARVLIPRPETEELVTLALRHIRPGQTVVDVGTGSGAIALSLAKESNAARIIGTDLSPGAIEVAEMNARAVLQGEDARTEFRLGNLLEPIADEGVDVIVSNPPYVALTERDELPTSVREWEPALALFGGDGGMVVIRELVSQAALRLRPGGVLLMEIDARRGAETLALSAEPQWAEARLLPDAFGRDRFVVARRSDFEATGSVAASGDASVAQRQ